ncbi:MAG: anti-sigma factor [Chitinophagales bacterium]
MRKVNLLFAFFISSIIFLTGCQDDDPVNANLTLSVSGLEDLGEDYAYEGWVIVDGSPVSTGIFTVDANGTPSASSFEVDAGDLDAATAYVLTIEPSPDSDPSPSAVHILAGDFSDAQASLSVGHDAALATDFSTAAGGFILATPTDGSMTTNENSGVWWLDPAAGPAPTLNLPTLPEGWAYEGWAVIDGTPVTTGRFTSASGEDDAAPFSGATAGPPYPGEDFLNNAPAGLSFPTDLSGRTIVVSVEPVPDNSPAPFLLKPLVGSAPSNATDRVVYDMGNNASATNPTGTVSR